MACSPAPPDPGNPPAVLAAQSTRLWEKERSRAPKTTAPRFPLCARADAGGEWLGWLTAADPRTAAPTRTACTGPEAARGADGARREMDAPEPAVTGGSTQHPREKLLPDPTVGSLGREGALLSQPQAAACQSQQVPVPRGRAGRRDPGDPHL